MLNIPLAESKRAMGFCKAVREGDEKKAVAILNSSEHAQEIDPNTIVADGKAPLHLAIERKQDNLLRALLDRKDTKLALVTENGFLTPLHVAASSGSLYAATLLLDRKVDPDYSHRTCALPIVYACQEGHQEIVELLINHGASVQKDALFSAVVGGHFGILQLLLEAGGDVEACDSYGWSLMHAAAFYNRPEIAQLLIQWRAPTALQDNDRNTPMAIAAFMRHQEIVNLLQ